MSCLVKYISGYFSLITSSCSAVPHQICLWYATVIHALHHFSPCNESHSGLLLLMHRVIRSADSLVY